jgi:hypothetical protein
MSPSDSSVAKAKPSPQQETGIAHTVFPNGAEQPT